MTTRVPLLVSLVLAAFALASPARAAEPTDDTAATYKRLSESVGPALVTVKFVMKPESGGDGGEGVDVELTALMVEKDGLVLASNVRMGGFDARVQPTNIRVLAGDDTEGLKARILARDRDLDLCWLRIDEEAVKGKTFRTIDFASGAPASVGDRVFMVSRMGKFFDHAISVREGRIGGQTVKPRSLLIHTGFVVNQRDLLGAPMFNADAKAIGVNVLQMPEKEDVEGGEGGQEGSIGILLLPAAEVVKATARGKEMAAKNPPKDEKKDDAKDSPKPKSDDKPAPEKKPEPKTP